MTAPRPPAVQYADSDGVSIAYQVLGEGPIDVVLVPGFVWHLEVVWEHPAAARFLQRLARFSRLVLWDKREQGLSDRTGRPPTLEHGMDDLRAVLDCVGSQRAVLFGISEGGPMSVLFAATYPERTSGLVLYGTYARILRGPDFPHGLPEAQLTRFMDDVSRQWGGPVAIDAFVPDSQGDPALGEWWSRLLRMGTGPSAVRDLLEMYAEIDVRPVLDAVQAPTLVLHREGDRISPVVQGRYMAERIPGARYVELPGRDHPPMVGDAEGLLDRVEEFVTGRPPETEPDRVLATVLFTDIVGSTERAAEVGDRRWRGLLDAHDDVVRREVERQRGRIVKTTGDGALATFDGPARAIRSATSARDALAGLGIQVRAGLHTGECEVRADDVGGIAVHIGARVAGEAAAGEVWISRTVADLVAGSGLVLDDRGEHELKGVPGPWRLYAVG